MLYFYILCGNISLKYITKQLKVLKAIVKANKTCFSGPEILCFFDRGEMLLNCLAQCVLQQPEVGQKTTTTTTLHAHINQSATSNHSLQQQQQQQPKGCSRLWLRFITSCQLRQQRLFCFT